MIVNEETLDNLTINLVVLDAIKYWGLNQDNWVIRGKYLSIKVVNNILVESISLHKVLNNTDYKWRLNYINNEGEQKSLWLNFKENSLCLTPRELNSY